MKKSVLAIILMMMFSLTVLAGGGKVNSWQTIEEKVCVVFLPPDLEEKCDINPVEQSGQIALCDLQVICTGEEESKDKD